MSEAELSLINKVELRIALAENDTQLEASLKLYLAPLLLKLASPHAAVRNAIFKVIQNLIPRITAARTIKLPIEALLEQVKASGDPAQAGLNTSVVLYSLLFVSRGIDRLSAEEKTQLVPKVISNIHTYPPQVSARLFNILCKLLDSWKVPERGSAQEETIGAFLGFDQRPEDEKFLARIIGKFLMLEPTASPVATPGLSVKESSFFTVDAGITFKSNQEIHALKVLLLDFLKAGFADTSVGVPLLIASADSSSAIKDPCEIRFKKLHTDPENKEYIYELIRLFVGTNDTPPVKSTLQDKIVQIFSKSKFVTSSDQISQIASVGLSSDYVRLKQSTVQFIKWVGLNNSEFASGSGHVLEEFNKSMALKLKENLQSEGWPQRDTSQVKNYSSSISQRLLHYEALGNILRANIDLIKNDPSYIEFLFQSLEGEVADMRSTIQDALSNLTIHLPRVSLDVKMKIKELGHYYLSKDIIDNDNLHSCRYISIKYINSTFNFEDAESRLLCILGAGKENRSDTTEEALRGLHPYWFNQLQSANTTDFKTTSELLGETTVVEFPQFGDFIKVFKNEIHRRKDAGSSFISLSKGIQFGLHVLIMQAIKGKNTVVVPDREWEVRVDKALEVDKQVRDLLIEEIAKLAKEDGIFTVYLGIIFEALYGQHNQGHISSDISYGDTFSKLISLAPSSVVEELISIAPRLLELTNDKISNDLALYQVAKSYGIITSHPANNDDVIRGLLNDVSETRGSLLATSYLVSRLVLRKRINLVLVDYLKRYCDILLKKITESSYYTVVLECIDQLSVYGALGPIINPEMEEYVKKFIDAIRPKVKKCDEKSVVALASLALALGKKVIELDNNPPIEILEDLNLVEQLIYDTHVSKQVEYTFTSGEAFVIATAGWESKLLERQIDIQGEKVEFVPSDLSRLPIILDRVLKSCANTKPSLRKASCIWLLSLVQYCGHLQSVKSKLTEAHISFMRFLGDKDELVQESASRGLSIVYEMGDFELKEVLVKGLLKSFTDTTSASKSSAGSVDHDTELFEENMFKVGDNSVSTYKDVLNLASDVGDPSLVYKFMSLAKTSSLWSSRKGMAFGLGSILSKSSLDNLLNNDSKLSSRLIPKLFRYKYDPSSAVQQSMIDIWNSLFKDTSKTINENFDIILEELLSGMGNKEWRVRQASTSGLADLLMLVLDERYEDHLERIWNMCFRVMDDIKESVRKESEKLSKVLTASLIRMIKTDKGSSVNVEGSRPSMVLHKLIPFLLGARGLMSDSEDVKNFSLETILKVCETKGPFIKPFIPTLLGNFINLMSSLEPEAINYIILNADKYNLKQNDLDSQRLQSLGRSPMMDIITKLINQVDESIIEEVVQHLVSSIKSSVGLPSKVCGSKVIIDLITKNSEIIKPYCERLLKVCVSQMSDKNETIVSSYAASAGYLSKVVSIDSVVSFAAHINKLYFESEDEKGREIAATSSEFVSKYSGEKFDLFASAFLPLAYIGRFDDNKKVRKCFEREWVENTTGSNYGIKLYFDEIMSFIRRYFQSSSFEIRKILAKSIINLSDSLKESSSVSKEGSLELVNLLIEANKGKSWDGKEFVFEALVKFSIIAKSSIDDDDLWEKVDRVVITEIKRRNKEYQKHAVKLAGHYIHHFHNEDVIEVYLEIMGKVLKDNYYKEDLGEIGDVYDSDEEDEDAMDVDLKPKISSKLNVELEEKKLSFIDNLIQSFYVTNGIFNHVLLQFILSQTKVLFHSKIIENTWRSKIAINELLSKVLVLVNPEDGSSKYPTLNSKEIDLLVENWTQLLLLCLDSDSIEKVKIQFIRFSSVISKFLHRLGDERADKVLRELEKFRESENSSVVRTELNRVLLK
ncbi:ARM repeat-containing protein [Suhomyces tanzawaensis NRRL Y-17324]|uniref:ARM repeat-containing protein n=1 Tax=Suhomyces tanzawaensis NRRL Y-17324 TaxID=984487 RepID=A0A1E4SIP7_9ASCO|nr:ARM repeat-containing protein [Suhomyces tanzawaensis NRRL Y-17324]ODV79379.1 ARM repeat-containing protein [Suhomyces tanzawaensis NRRL Y-17324]